MQCVHNYKAVSVTIVRIGPGGRRTADSFYIFFLSFFFFFYFLFLFLFCGSIRLRYYSTAVLILFIVDLFGLVRLHVSKYRIVCTEYDCAFQPGLAYLKLRSRAF